TSASPPPGPRPGRCASRTVRMRCTARPSPRSSYGALKNESQNDESRKHMQLKDKVIVVTGGAHGIGRALCRRFAAEGARGIVVADRDSEGAEQVAGAIGGLAVAVDVGVEADLVRLVRTATSTYGPIDLFCSNAGIIKVGGVETADVDWQDIW